MNGKISPIVLCDIAIHRKRGMEGRMHTLRHRVALRTIGRRFGFLVTKDVVQLLHNFIFELQALIGIECFGWSEDTRYPFDKSFRNGSALSCPEVRRAQQNK